MYLQELQKIFSKKIVIKRVCSDPPWAIHLVEKIFIHESFYVTIWQEPNIKKAML